MKWLILLYIVLNPLFFLVGVDARSSQELFYQLSSVALFASGLFFSNREMKRSNINICLGILLLLFLHQWLRTSYGWSVALNFLLGLLVYFTIIKTFKKENIRFILKGFLWIGIFATIVLAFQHLGYDFRDAVLIDNRSHCPLESIFWQRSAMGMYFAQVIALGSALTPLSLLFFLPIKDSLCAGAVLGAGAGFMFYIWFRRRIFFWIMVPVMFASGIYGLCTEENYKSFTVRLPLWGMVVQDIARLPIGHGLDSFANPHFEGTWRYYKHSHSDRWMRVKLHNGEFEPEEKDKKFFDSVPEGQKRVIFYDNAHNEFLQIAYEIGLHALIVLIFLMVFIWRRFWQSVKDPETVALMAGLVTFAIIAFVQFPFHIARIGHLLPIMAGLFMVKTED